MVIYTHFPACKIIRNIVVLVYGLFIRVENRSNLDVGSRPDCYSDVDIMPFHFKQTVSSPVSHVFLPLGAPQMRHLFRMDRLRSR
jgi:hypothetical protein